MTISEFVAQTETEKNAAAAAELDRQRRAADQTAMRALLVSNLVTAFTAPSRPASVSPPVMEIPVPCYNCGSPRSVFVEGNGADAEAWLPDGGRFCSCSFEPTPAERQAIEDEAIAIVNGEER